MSGESLSPTLTTSVGQKAARARSPRGKPSPHVSSSRYPFRGSSENTIAPFLLQRHVGTHLRPFPGLQGPAFSAAVGGHSKTGKLGKSSHERVPGAESRGIREGSVMHGSCAEPGGGVWAICYEFPNILKPEGDLGKSSSFAPGCSGNGISPVPDSCPWQGCFPREEL